MDSSIIDASQRRRVSKAAVAMSPAEFLVEPDTMLDEVLRIAGQDWKILLEKGIALDMRYLDTFDWRLYRAGQIMYAMRRYRRGELALETVRGEMLQRLAGTDIPNFARDLPAGRMRDAIASQTEPRRLFELARIKVHERIARILNSDEKTVVRLVLQTRTLSATGQDRQAIALPAVVRVVPVKGYWKENAAVHALLSEKLGVAASPEGAFRSVMEAAGQSPAGYKSKVTVPLSPQQRSDDAVRGIYRTLFKTMQVNTDGVRRSLDPEFLHDYRVAIRGTRSLLRQVRGVFREEDARHFSNEFKWLGTLSGRVRDLDVNLIKMEDFRADLPADIREHLEPLEKYLRADHVKEQRRLVRSLKSDRYLSLMDSWSAFLARQSSGDDGVCPNAARPVIDLATERIWRTYKRVWKTGRVIEESTPAVALHSLRIECKKLRNLLEFFSSLYPADEMRKLIQTLKQLQTNLGDFNDCEVQRHTLRQFADEMHKEGLASADSLLAMGRLMDHLSNQQHEERLRFEACFESFGRADNRLRYRRLFKIPEATH